MIASLMLESPVALVPVRETMQGGAHQDRDQEINRLESREIGVRDLAEASVILRPLATSIVIGREANAPSRRKAFENFVAWK